MRRKFAIVFVLLSLAYEAFADNKDVLIQYNGDGSVKFIPEQVDGIKFNTDGAHVKAIVIDSLLPSNNPTFKFTLSGESMDGSFSLKSKDSTIVVLDGLNITSRQGAPLWINTKTGSLLSVNEEKENILTLVAVKDTAKQKSAVLFANSDLNICGKGRLVLTSFANGCKGINVKNNLKISDLKLEVITEGDNLGPDTLRRMGPPMGFGGPMPMDFDPENLPEEVKAHFEQMKKEGHDHDNGGPQEMPHGDMPQGGFGGFPGGGMPQGGFPEGGFGEGGFPEGGFPGGDFGGKQKFLGTCKGIKAGGQITIDSGYITVSTKSRGAEGIEGKAGVTINGGVVYVKAMDDAINSNGKISFNGGETTAWSMGNDAVDANGWGDGAITITGGKVYGYCQQGAPEEGFDSDFSPIVITGGTVFGIGAGMGDMPSSPSEETSKQPSIIFLGLNVNEGDNVELFIASNKKTPVATIVETLPFSFQNSSSLFTSPELKVGEEYILKTGKKKIKFKLTSNFQTVGKSQQMIGPGGFPGGFPGGPGRGNGGFGRPGGIGGPGGFPGGQGMPF